MGRTWKFTQQIYEELKEAINKKIETRFDTGVIAGGPMGMFGNPFEKYADEINMGISKMNSYVDMINEADGFDEAKLDRVYGEIAEIDKRYGNQIKLCTENLEHYKNILYQLEVVMEQAAVGSMNGMAFFNFDRQEFRERVADDKHAMDITYVDRILEKDASEITYEEYARIVVLIGNQLQGDLTLVSHILNSEYCWQFVDVNLLPGGEGVAEGAGVAQSFGALIPSEKYVMLMAALEKYAEELSINQPIENCPAGYMQLRDRIFCCTELFAMLANNAAGNEWQYMFGENQERDMVRFCLEGGMFHLEETEEDEWTIRIKMEGNIEAELKVKGACSGSYANTNLIELEHEYINAYLGLNDTVGQVIAQSVAGNIWDKIKGDAFAGAMEEVFGGTIAPYITTGIGMLTGVVNDVNAHNDAINNITEYEEWGDYTKTLEFTDLNCSIGNFTLGYDTESHANVTFREGNETAERLYVLNSLLSSPVGEEYIYGDELSSVPQGGFSVEYIIQNMEEASSALTYIEESLKQHGYADTLIEAVQKYKEEMIKKGEWTYE